MEYTLEKGEVVCFDAVAGRQMLQAVSGIIWLTCSADPGDHILTPGSRFFVNQAESIVLEALEPASFSLASADAPARIVIKFSPALPHFSPKPH